MVRDILDKYTKIKEFSEFIMELLIRLKNHNLKDPFSESVEDTVSFSLSL